MITSGVVTTAFNLAVEFGSALGTLRRVFDAIEDKRVPIPKLDQYPIPVADGRSRAETQPRKCPGSREHLKLPIRTTGNRSKHKSTGAPADQCEIALESRDCPLVVISRAFRPVFNPPTESNNIGIVGVATDGLETGLKFPVLPDLPPRAWTMVAVSAAFPVRVVRSLQLLAITMFEIVRERIDRRDRGERPHQLTIWRFINSDLFRSLRAKIGRVNYRPANRWMRLQPKQPRVIAVWPATKHNPQDRFDLVDLVIYKRAS